MTEYSVGTKLEILKLDFIRCGQEEAYFMSPSVPTTLSVLKMDSATLVEW